MGVFLRADALSNVQEFFDQLPEVATRAAMLSLNQVAEREAVPMIRHDAEQQVSFPSGYLDQPDRLGVSRKATSGSLEVVITARDRPTSLARFAPGQTPSNTRNTGVTLQVKKGRTLHLKKAFLVNLKSGNIGLAVRLKPGETIANKREKVVQLDRNVFLLYGPSVDQVFRGVAEHALPEIGNMTSREFLRQFARLTHG